MAGNQVHLKSADEIAAMRESADLVGRALAVVAPLVQPGARTSDLDQVAETFILDHGARPAFKGYRVGSLVFPSTLCVSVNDEVVHGIPDDRTLVDGDVVSIDCGAVLNGFYGDSAFTFGVGTLDDAVADLCRVTYESLLEGMSRAVMGGRVGDISEAVQRRCERGGYGVVRDLVGHGIGRSLHEAPQVPNFGRRGVGRKLKRGLVICIEPMVNLGSGEVTTEPDGWTIRTADRRPSAHYEHMVAVGPGGPEVLTTFRHIEAAVTPPYASRGVLDRGPEAGRTGVSGDTGSGSAARVNQDEPQALTAG